MPYAHVYPLNVSYVLLSNSSKSIFPVKIEIGAKNTSSGNKDMFTNGDNKKYPD